jgi:hypothetical protein
MEWIPVVVIVAVSIGTALWYAFRQRNPAEASEQSSNRGDANTHDD